MKSEDFFFSGIIHPRVDAYDSPDYYGFGLRPDELPKVADKFIGKPLLVDHYRSSPTGDIMEEDKCGIIADAWVDDPTGNLMGIFNVNLSTKKGREAMNDIVNEKKLSLSFGSLAIVVDPDHDKEIKTRPIRVMEFKELEEVSLCYDPAIEGSKIKSVHYYVDGEPQLRRIYNSLEKQKEKMSDLVRDQVPAVETTQAAAPPTPPVVNTQALLQKGIENASADLQNAKARDSELDQLKALYAQEKKEKEELIAQNKKEKEEQDRIHKEKEIENNRIKHEKLVAKFKTQFMKMAELFKATGQMTEHDHVLKHMDNTLEEISTTGEPQTSEARQLVTTLAANSDEIAQSGFTLQELKLKQENEKRAITEKETNERMDKLIAKKDETIAKKDETIKKAAQHMLPNVAKAVLGGNAATTTSEKNEEVADTTSSNATSSGGGQVERTYASNKWGGKGGKGDVEARVSNLYKLENGKRVRTLASNEMDEIDPAFEAHPLFKRWAMSNPDIYEVCATSDTDFQINHPKLMKEYLKNQKSNV